MKQAVAGYTWSVAFEVYKTNKRWEFVSYLKYL